MPRTYHHIISLGLNCEPSFVLEDMYGRLDSYPFSWTLIPDAAHLARALRRRDLLFSEGYAIAPDSFDMFRCLRTNIQFHGKTSLRACNYARETVEAAFVELVSRMEYLCRKFDKALSSGRDILYIVKNHHRDGSAQGFSEREALEMREALNEAAGNAGTGRHDLLFLDRLGCEPAFFTPDLEAQGIYKRLLEGFAPGERAYLYDISGWTRIFAEFDSTHSPVAGESGAERQREIRQRLEERRAVRLRDIQERMRQSPRVEN